MRKEHSPKVLILACVILFPALIVPPLNLQNQSQKVAVRPLDSISYLALRHYGFYNDSLLGVLQRVNPQIQDWQNLKSGATLELPALPASAPRWEKLRGAADLAVLTFFEGEVKYLRGPNRQYQPAKLNLILRPGDEILTGKNSRVELVLNERSVLRLEAHSRLQIITLKRAAPGPAGYQASFDLLIGSVWTHILKVLDRAPKVDLRFPTAIAGVQGTSYRARVENDSTTNVRVYDGAVEVRSRSTGPPQQIGPPQQVPGPREITLEAWTKLVRAQQEIIIAKSGRPDDPRPFTDQAAEAAWVRWNQTRDRDLHAER